jgi:hypothetical protein
LVPEAGASHELVLRASQGAALDNLGERLLDANRTIGRPDKITVIFGRKITKQYRGKLQTEIEDMNLPNPVIRTFGKPLGSLVGFDIGDESVLVLVEVDAADLLDSLLHSRHCCLHRGFKARGQIR